MKAHCNKVFVNIENIRKLIDKSDSTHYKHLRNIRKMFNVRKPQLVTVDQTCIYFNITKADYFASQDE